MNSRPKSKGRTPSSQAKTEAPPTAHPPPPRPLCICTGCAGHSSGRPCVPAHQRQCGTPQQRHLRLRFIFRVLRSITSSAAGAATHTISGSSPPTTVKICADRVRRNLLLPSHLQTQRSASILSVCAKVALVYPPFSTI